MLPVMEHSGSLRWNLLAVEMFEMTTKELEHYRSLANKAVSGFERADSNFERHATTGKMLSISITCHREITHERKSQMIWQPHCVWTPDPQRLGDS